MMPAVLPPLCLRSHRYLLPPDGRAVYTCLEQPECPGGETYTLQVPGTRGDAAVALALSIAERDLGRSRPDSLTVWMAEPDEAPGWPGMVPERNVDEAGHPTIYLTGTTADQMTYQAAHEVVHVLFTPVGTHHWMHETAAQIFAIDVIRIAFPKYAKRSIESLEEMAAMLPLARLMDVADHPYPAGMYGRASSFGRQLVGIVGPVGYKGMLTSFNEAGKPDFSSWVDGLPAKQRRRIGILIARG